MCIDYSKRRRLLIIHGVQAGTDGDMRQHEEIRRNVVRLLAGTKIPFETDIFRYEDINDDAVRVVRQALAALTDNRIVGWIVDNSVDVNGDVAEALRQGPAYRAIKERFTERIVESYARGEPLFIVAHSLGSIYAFDVVNELMRRSGLFQWNKPETRPVQGMVTLGSPISLDLFCRTWRSMTNLVPKGAEVDGGTKLFPWINCWDPADPIVSGNIIGLSWGELQFAIKFGEKPFKMGWDVRSRMISSRRRHLSAHTAYWNEEAVGFTLRWILERYGMIS